MPATDVNEAEQFQNMIDRINQREAKDYQEMGLEEISHALREAMTLEQKFFEEIEGMEKKGATSEMAKYARMICRNTMEREIADIQETYLKKIDTYLESRK